MRRAPNLAIALVVAILVALGAAGYWWLTQPDAIPEGPVHGDPAPADSHTAAPATGGTTAPETTKEVAQRDPVAYVSTARAVEGAHLLRVIFEGLTDERAAQAKITVATYDNEKQRTARIQESWPSKGTTSAFAIDDYLADVAERFADQRFDELKVVVEHPQFLRETLRIPATAGVQSDNGQTVYEARVKFAEVVFWPEVTLSVRDAVTRKHLEDVELRAVPTAFMGLHQQPGDDGPFSMHGEGLDSPIALLGGRKQDATDEEVAGLALRPVAGETAMPVDLSQPEDVSRGVMIYARAPGYAWGRIVINVSTGGERELLLGPATSLNVRFTNVQLAQYAKLDKPATLCIGGVRPDGGLDGVFFCELDETNAVEGVRIDGLEPGEHSISVEIGHSFSWRKRHVLAGEKLELVAGKQHDVMLALADSPGIPEPATLGGTLSFPAFGREKDVRLWFYKSDFLYGDPDYELSLADMEPTTGTLPSWTFRLENLPVGRYQARLMPFDKNWMFELPSGGRDDLTLTVPELAEVVIDAIDARTGERVPLPVIRHFSVEELPDRIHKNHSSHRNVIPFEGEPGRFRIWTVPGPAWIRTFRIPDELDYAYRRQDLELAPGLQHVRFELGPRYTIKFEFRVDGATLPRDDGIYSGIAKTVRGIGHDGRAGYLSYWMLQADNPGLYEITFEGIGEDRFRPIPPRQIEVREGETTEVVVELERK